MITDLLGNRIPSGRIVRQLTADFLTGSRPTWLAVASGTESFGGESTERYYQLATAAVLGSTAKLTLPTLQSDQFTGLFLTLEGLHFDEDDAISFHFGFNASSAGAVILQASSEVPSLGTTAMLRVKNPNTDYAVPYLIRGSGEALRHRNITFALYPQVGQVFLMEDDQVFFHRDISEDLTNGVLTPEISLTTNEAASHWLRLSQVKLMVEHN